MATKKLLRHRDLDSGSSGKGEWNRKWLVIFILILLVFTASTLVIIIIAMEQSRQSLPDKIDVILYVRPDETLREKRMEPHIRAVQKYMTWANTIYVLTPKRDSGKDTTLGVTFVNFTGSLTQAFEYIPSIDGIAEHAIFLSDQTFPFSTVYKSYLFYDSRPRMFNIFKEQSETLFFQKYLETTMPTLVLTIENLVGETWDELVFKEVTEERVTLRHDLNRDIFIDSKMGTDNTEKQFDKLKSSRPFFATFHIGSDDTDPDTSNTRLNNFLGAEFPEKG